MMELKFIVNVVFCFGYNSLNRTMMELKSGMLRFLIESNICLNRTMMELKS